MEAQSSGAAAQQNDTRPSADASSQHYPAVFID